jgi:DNA-binding CsgD family transcriptional regulator
VINFVREKEIEMVAPRAHAGGKRMAAAIEREATVIQMVAEHMTHTEIARRMGVSRQRVEQIWKRGIERLPIANLNEHRTNQLQLIMTAIRELLVIARNPAVSPRTRVEAWSTIRGWVEREARLLGTDAIQRREISVVTTDAVDAAIHDLEAELALQAARAGIALPKVTR